MTATLFMDLPTAKDIERIFLVTDRLHLHRDWVVVSLGWGGQAREFVQPDGKIQLRPPGGDLFEPWLSGLAARLSSIHHFRTVRRRYLGDHAGLNIG
jgi:hypothetical protein